MNKTRQKTDAGNSLPTKWIYAIIVVLALGFGAYGYFQVKKWMRYANIESSEKPITDYTITKVYSDQDSPQYKRRHRGNNDNEKEEKPNYFMEVTYKGKDYKLEIEDHTYSDYQSNPGNVTLYYDAEGDEVFVAGTGGGNLLVAILVAIVAAIVIVILLIWLLISSMKKKKGKKKR